MKSSEQLYQEAAELDARITGMHDTVSNHTVKDVREQIGLALLKSPLGKSVKEMLYRWDKNSDGDLDKSEFRNGIQFARPFGLGLEHVDSKEVDLIFDGYDTDGSGALELKELQVALESLMQIAKSGSAEMTSIKQMAQKLKEVLARTRECAEATLASEKALESFMKKQERVPADIQLGRVIKENSIKIVDLLLTWDTNQDGSVGKKEFRKHIHKMGIQASGEEVDALFDRFNTSADDSQLALAELKPAFKAMIDAARRFQEECTEMEKAGVYAFKCAKKLQVSLATANAAEMRTNLEIEATAAAQKQEKERHLQADVAHKVVDGKAQRLAARAEADRLKAEAVRAQAKAAEQAKEEVKMQDEQRKIERRQELQHTFAENRKASMSPIPSPAPSPAPVRQANIHAPWEHESDQEGASEDEG